MTSTSREKIFTELSELVGFNSVHGDPNLAEQHRGAADWTAAALREQGLQVEEIDTSDGSRAIIGRKPAAEGMPTILLYSHYDIVPAGDHYDWVSDPFTLTERDGRWYARGAADCKGNIAMHLEALRQVRAAGGTELGLIVLVEGSEENGGVGLGELIETRPELFDSEVIIIADVGNAAVGKPTLTTSLRGGAQITVSVDTLASPMHSGMFGGAAPDAVAALVRILDSLRDEHGRTTIDGVDATASWNGADYDAAIFRKDATVLPGVDLLTGPGDSPADLVWARPAVTVTGFSSTPVEEAVNAVPATASAAINLRVPHGVDARETAQKLVAHLENHAPWGAKVTATIHEINKPFATDTDSDAVAHLGKSLAQAYGAESVTQIGSGGSIPLATSLQDTFPDAAIALYGVEEPKTTIHSSNESVDPTEIEHVAAAEAHFLRTYGKN